ncbi:hypothetical protein SDC9_201768 [bioreactor metagenome]|uniref:Uncharacterized protein n=1 Tax=bioreactor metagenome TaxID=1076179 RepID=A0A645IUL1_9ZZZZ
MFLGSNHKKFIVIVGKKFLSGHDVIGDVECWEAVAPVRTPVGNCERKAERFALARLLSGELHALDLHGVWAGFRMAKIVFPRSVS